jgi:hypothetical protein
MIKKGVEERIRSRKEKEQIDKKERINRRKTRRSREREGEEN